jgi:hypothetical protein
MQLQITSDIMYGSLNLNLLKFKTLIIKHLVVIVIYTFKLQKYISMEFMYVNTNMSGWEKEDLFIP